MKGTAAYYSSDLKIKDTRFSIDYLQDYSLLLQAGETEFQLAVVDTKANRCLLLEHYTFHRVSSVDDYQRLLENLFDDHHLLMAGFWHSVRFAIKNTRFSLVPAALFDKEQLPAYLRLTSPLLPTDTPHFYRHGKNNLVTVFAAENVLLDWLKKRYPNLKVQILHHISAFIEGVLHLPDLSQERDLFLLIEGGILSVVMCSGQKLAYANLFRCKAPADLLRYLMMLIQHFKLNQATSRIKLWGNISPESPWFREIKPYFGNLSFGGRPRFLSFTYMFDEAPESRFFDLLNLHICE